MRVIVSKPNLEDIGRLELARARGIHLINNTVDPRIVNPGASLDAFGDGRVRRAAIEGYLNPYHRAPLEFGDRVVMLPPYTSWGNTEPEGDRARLRQVATYRAFVEGRTMRHELV